MSNVRIGISPHFFAATHLLGKMVMNSYHINVQLLTVTDDHIEHNQIFKDRLLVSTISVKREYIHQNGRGIYSILKRLSYLYMLNVCSL